MGDAGPPTPLADVELAQAHEQPQPVREINVLVTGFGPFKTFTTNPSWLIAQSLPSHLDPLPPNPPSDPTPEPAGISTQAVPQSTLSQPPTAAPGSAQASLNRHLAALLKSQHQNQQPEPTSHPIRPANHQPYRVNLHTYGPVRVSYSPTSVLIPSLLDPRTNGGAQYDYILHIGLASGRDSYTLETQAHRDDYLIPDVDEQTGYTAGEKIWKRLRISGRLECGWDAGDVLRRWVESVSQDWEGFVAQYTETEERRLERDFGNGNGREDNGDEEEGKSEEEQNGGTGYVSRHGIFGLRSNTALQDRAGESVVKPPRKPVVKLSKDAGRFLCEFIFMCSLVVRWREAQAWALAHTRARVAAASGRNTQKQSIDGTGDVRSDSDDPREKVGKVAFLHVPNGTDETSIAIGALVAQSAIRAVVSSWEDGYRNPAVYGSETVGRTAGTTQTQTQTVHGEGGAFETRGTGDREGATIEH